MCEELARRSIPIVELKTATDHNWETRLPAELRELGFGPTDCIMQSNEFGPVNEPGRLPPPAHPSFPVLARAGPLVFARSDTGVNTSARA